MLIHLLRLHPIYSLYVSPSLTACRQRFVSLTFILTVFARRRWNKPGDLVTAGHGEQPLPLKNPVPRLDGVTGADRDGSLTWLDLGAELPAGLSVRVSVSLIWDRKEDKHRHSEDLAVKYAFLMTVKSSSGHSERRTVRLWAVIRSPSTPASWGEKMRASPQGEVLMYRWNWTFSFSLKPCLLSHRVKMDLWWSSSWLLGSQMWNQWTNRISINH